MNDREILTATMAHLARDVTATFDGPCGTNYASWARSLRIRAHAIIDEATKATAALPAAAQATTPDKLCHEIEALHEALGPHRARREYERAAAAQADGEEVASGTLSQRIRPNSEAAPWVCDEVRRLESELVRLRARPAPSPVKVNMLEHANGIEVREVLSDGTDRMVVVVPRDVFIPAPSHALVEALDGYADLLETIAGGRIGHAPNRVYSDLLFDVDNIQARWAAVNAARSSLPAAKKEGGS